MIPMAVKLEGADDRGDLKVGIRAGVQLEKEVDFTGSADHFVDMCSQAKIMANKCF